MNLQFETKIKGLEGNSISKEKDLFLSLISSSNEISANEFDSDQVFSSTIVPTDAQVVNLTTLFNLTNTDVSSVFAQLFDTDAETFNNNDQKFAVTVNGNAVANGSVISMLNIDTLAGDIVLTMPTFPTGRTFSLFVIVSTR